MRKKSWRLLALLLVIINLIPIGCYDYQEIDETAYILVLGLDKGKENKLTLTAQIAVPKNIGGAGGGGMGGSSGGGKPAETMSVEAPGITSALNLLNTFVARRMSLKHVKAILFSEELAREGVIPYLSVITRYPEFRRNVFVAVARGVSAKELLEKNNPVLESNPAKYVELASLSARFTAFSPLQPQLNRFYNAAHSMGADPVAVLVGMRRQLPQGEGPPVQPPYGWTSEGAYLAGKIPRSGGSDTEVMGAALFKDDKLVDVVDGDETTALMLIRNTFNQAYLTLPDPMKPEQMVALNLHQHQVPRFKIDVSGPIPRIAVEVFAEGYVMGIQSHSNYEDPRFRPILEEATAERIRTDIVRFLQRTQALGVDSGWIGKRAAVHFLTWKEWEDYRWDEVYPQAPIDVKVVVNLRSFGLTRESAESLRTPE